MGSLFGPDYKFQPNGDGTVSVTVSPPNWTGFSPSTLILTESQFARLGEWLENRNIMIQDAFPELSPGDREILLSGIKSADWDNMIGDEE